MAEMNFDELFKTAAKGRFAENTLLGKEEVINRPIGDNILNAKLNSFWNIITKDYANTEVSAINNPLYYAQIYYDLFQKVKNENKSEQSISFSQIDILDLALADYKSNMINSGIFSFVYRSNKSKQLRRELINATNGTDSKTTINIDERINKAEAFWNKIKNKNFKSDKDVSYAENLFHMCYNNYQRMVTFDAFLSFLTNDYNKNLGKMSERVTDFSNISNLSVGINERMTEIYSRYQALSSQSRNIKIQNLKINPLLVEPSVSLATIKEIENIVKNSNEKFTYFTNMAQFFNKNSDEGKKVGALFKNISQLSQIYKGNEDVINRLKYIVVNKIANPNASAGTLDNLSTFVSDLIDYTNKNSEILKQVTLKEVLRAANANAIFEGSFLMTAINNVPFLKNGNIVSVERFFERAKVTREIANLSKSQNMKSEALIALKKIKSDYLNPSFNPSPIEIKSKKEKFTVYADTKSADTNGFATKFVLYNRDGMRTAFVSKDDLEKFYDVSKDKTKATLKNNSNSKAYVIPNGESINILGNVYQGPKVITFSYKGNSKNIDSDSITEMSREVFERTYSYKNTNGDLWNDSCNCGLNYEYTSSLISQVKNGFEKVLLYSKEKPDSYSLNNSIMQSYLSGANKTEFKDLYSLTNRDFPLNVIVNKTISMISNNPSDSQLIENTAFSIMQLGVTLKGKKLNSNQIGQLIDSCNSVAEIHDLYEAANENQNNSNLYQTLQNAHNKFLSENLFYTIGENETIRFTHILKDTVQTLTLTQSQYENARIFNQNDADEQANKQSHQSPWEELCTYAKEIEKIEVITIKKSQGNPQNGKKPNNDSYRKALNSLAYAKTVSSSNLSSLDNKLNLNLYSIDLTSGVDLTSGKSRSNGIPKNDLGRNSRRIN